jgi:hypothetical protein
MKQANTTYEDIRKIIQSEYEKQTMDTNYNFISRFAKAVSDSCAINPIIFPDDKTVQDALDKEWETSSLPKTKGERDLYYIAFHKGQEWMKQEIVKSNLPSDK